MTHTPIMVFLTAVAGIAITFAAIHLTTRMLKGGDRVYALGFGLLIAAMLVAGAWFILIETSVSEGIRARAITSLFWGAVLVLVLARLRAVVRSLRLAGEELEVAHAVARDYLDVEGIYIIALDTDGRVLEMNHALRSALGIGGDPRGLDFVQTCIPEDARERAAAEFRSFARGLSGDTLESRHPICVGEDEVRMVAWSCRLLRYGAGAPSGILCSGIDTTQIETIQRALVESEQRYRSLFESNSVAVFIADMEGGTILDANPAAEALFGWSHDDLTQMRVSEFVTESEARVDEWMRRSFADGEGTRELQIQTKDGGVRDIQVHTGPMLFGRRRALHGIILDVTERLAAERAAEDSRRMYRALFEHMDDGFAHHEVVYDAYGTPVDYVFLEVNEAFGTLTGLDSADVVGRRVTEVIPSLRDAEFDWIGEYGRIAADGGVLHFEQPVDELERWFAVSAYRTEPGRFATVFRDVTGQREAKDALERAVRERTEELTNAYLELEKATAAKDEFLASMSHELRTPLNSIIGFSGIMLQGIAGDVTPEQERQLKMVNRSGTHLLELVNGVLDLAKIEAGAITPEPVDFCLMEAAEGAIQTIAPQAEEKGLQILARGTSEHIPVCTDELRVQQILLNLLSNAVKFTESGSITVDVSSNGNGFASIDVIDTGPGIEPEHQAEVFREFVQVARGDTAKPMGTGLGLSVSRRIARSLGGDITLDSTPGVGSTFTVTLPREFGCEETRGRD